MEKLLNDSLYFENSSGKIYNMDCLCGLKQLSSNSIDLTVTSPPYDNLRTYHGYTFDFEDIAKELFRVTKEGGVVVWIVGDATIDGSETGTSFRQALYFMECGFKLHDTMIWNKGGFSAVGALRTRYAPVFEYMFVFVKNHLSKFNPIKDHKNKHVGVVVSKTKRQSDGTLKSGNSYISTEFGQRYNIWDIFPQGNTTGHPAPFPEQLVNDHIISWSNKGDIILDPFMGSGTTAKMAQVNFRKFIGFEISEEYCCIIKNRLEGLSNLFYD